MLSCAAIYYAIVSIIVYYLLLEIVVMVTNWTGEKLSRLSSCERRCDSAGIGRVLQEQLGISPDS